MQPSQALSIWKLTDVSLVSAMNRRAAERYPEQYRAANQRYPAPVDY